MCTISHNNLDGQNEQATSRGRASCCRFDDGIPAVGDSLQTLLAPRRPLLLFFVHPECGPCGMLLPQVVAWHDTYRERLAIALITSTSDRGAADPPQYQVLTTLVEEARAVSKGFQSMSMPSAVLVRPDGTIGSQLAIGGAAIENLINWLTSGP